MNNIFFCIEIQHKILEGIQAEREKWERDAEQKELKKELNEKNYV
jgi:hypothetical protein